MIAFDTNVLVRVLTNDDPAQARRAMARLRSDTVWISRTVLLETEWVLRHAYGLDAGAIGGAFTRLMGVPTVDVEARDAVLEALGWHQQGMDFADALHLAMSSGAAAFVTSDKALEKTAKRLGVKPNVAAP
jgi:predicted nucleic-acid-binding protein